MLGKPSNQCVLKFGRRRRRGRANLSVGILTDWGKFCFLCGYQGSQVSKQTHCDKNTDPIQTHFNTKYRPFTDQSSLKYKPFKTYIFYKSKWSYYYSPHLPITSYISKIAYKFKHWLIKSIIYSIFFLINQLLITLITKISYFLSLF